MLSYVYACTRIDVKNGGLAPDFGPDQVSEERLSAYTAGSGRPTWYAEGLLNE